MLHRKLMAATGLALSVGLGVSAVNADKVYWVDGVGLFGGGAIRRANLDGTNVEALQTGLVGPFGMALDLEAGKMYVAESGSGVGPSEVQRFDLDGSNMETLFQGPVGSFFDGITLDIDGGKVYVADGGGDRIMRANLVDGSNIEVLVSGLAPLTPRDIVLDLAGGKMYWTHSGATNAGPAGITRANLDGSNIEDIPTGGEGSGGGIAIDTIEGKVYWTKGGFPPKIMRANLDGTNVEEVIASELINPKRIALDVGAGKIYWTNTTSTFPQSPLAISRANLDGTNLEHIITTGVSLSPWGIALDLRPDCNNNGIPDENETDSDGDGVIDDCDNCPLVANPLEVIVDPTVEAVGRDEAPTGQPLDGIFDVIVGPVGPVFNLNAELRPAPNDPPFEERSIIEFDITHLGPAAAIDAVTIFLRENGRGGLPLIEIYGYTGNGAVELTDMDIGGKQLLTQIQLSSDSTLNNQLLASMDVTAFVRESTFSSASFAGFLVKNATGGSLGIWSFERFASSTVSPKLIVNLDAQPDTDGDGVGDACDLCPGGNDLVDSDGDTVPDFCDLCLGFDDRIDCNNNGTPDTCEIADCVADPACGDCNGNGIPDGCELAGNDCNTNGIPDECEPDCDNDGIPDDCELDCNGNTVPDQCEIAGGSTPDCNGNGIPDTCDIADCVGDPDCGDINGNGIPDGCDVETPILAPPPHDILKNRYISIDPRGGGGVNFGKDFDIRLTLSSTLVNGVTAVGSQWWANAPDANCISIVGPTRPLTPPNWDACPVLHLTGCPIIPTSDYDIVAILGNTVSAPPLAAATQAKPDPKWFGDVVGNFDAVLVAWTAPNGTVNIDDALAAIKTFQDINAINATHLSVTDLQPNRPDLPAPGNQIDKVVNIADVLSIIIGFQGNQYPGGQIELCLCEAPSCP